MRDRPVIIALIGAAGLLFLYLFFPPGITPDSVHYLHAAQSLAHEGTLLRYGGTPFVTWPPLYPAALAVFITAGLSPFVAVKALNLLAYLLYAFYGWQPVRLLPGRTGIRRAAYALLMWGYPVLTVMLHAWSEPLFLALTAAFVTYALRYLKDRRPADRLGVVITLALAPLQRYIGIVWIGVWVLWLLLWGQGPFRRRLRTALLTAGPAMIPLAAWLIRNYAVTHTLTGMRAAPALSFYQWAIRAVWTVAEWCLPIMLSHPIWSILMAAGGLIILRHMRTSFRLPLSVPEKMLWSGALSYLTLLAISSSLTYVDSPRQRLLAPIYPLIIPALMLRLRHVTRPKRLAFLAMLFLALFFHDLRLGISLWRGGGLTFTHRRWQTHPAIAWARKHHNDSTAIFSNLPEIFYVHARMTTDPVRPTWHVSTPMEAIRWPEGKTVYVIWFTTRHPSWLHPIDSLRAHFPMRKVRQFAGARVWKLERP